AASGQPAATAAVGPGERVSARRRLRWLALTFVPSSLMLGVTLTITTDIAAVPMLWVAPLALYLLTFVLAFARRRILPVTRVSAALPWVVLPIAALTFVDVHGWEWLFVPVHLLAFFVASLLCHQRLADDRPAPEHLTGFYLIVATGGVLGGLF